MIPIEFRKVVVETRHEGGASESEHFEFRVCISAQDLGVSKTAWSDWMRLDVVVVRQDQNGNSL